MMPIRDQDKNQEHIYSDLQMILLKSIQQLRLYILQKVPKWWYLPWMETKHTLYYIFQNYKVM